MKFVALATVVASAAALAGATPVRRTSCIDAKVGITASATNFNIATGAPLNVTGTYKIHGKYCPPTSVVAAHSKTLLIMAHGITYNTYYWDSTFQPEKYSFVRHAASQGYATLNVDRLGYGGSDHPDPDNVVQFPLSSAVMAEIFKQVRAVRIPGVPSFQKLVYVGHSAGSIVGNGVLINAPTVADGAVLTGFSHFFTSADLISLYNIQSAAQNSARFKALPADYITTGDLAHRTNAFYGPTGTFDPAAAQCDESNKDTTTVGEGATFGVFLAPAPSFKGHVFIVNGQKDILFCESDGCPNLATEGQNFPSAKSFSSVVIPNTGHSLNMQSSAQQTFAKITTWLSTHGF